jgi:hypothetical protein
VLQGATQSPSPPASCSPYRLPLPLLLLLLPLPLLLPLLLLLLLLLPLQVRIEDPCVSPEDIQCAVQAALFEAERARSKRLRREDSGTMQA